MTAWTAPSEEQRERERQDIAMRREAAEPYGPAEFAQLDQTWSQPGVHQWTGNVDVIYRLIETIKRLK